jgi:hypothetical protein
LFVVKISTEKRQGSNQELKAWYVWWEYIIIISYSIEKCDIIYIRMTYDKLHYASYNLYSYFEFIEEQCFSVGYIFINSTTTIKILSVKKYTFFLILCFCFLVFLLERCSILFATNLNNWYSHENPIK